jgi:hypothetical protein
MLNLTGNLIVTNFQIGLITVFVSFIIDRKKDSRDSSSNLLPVQDQVLNELTNQTELLFPLVDKQESGMVCSQL